MSIPRLEIPTGGGAIRGIGEKFTFNAFTGTGSLSIPLPMPAARGDFGPKLELSYDSGLGNGLFGAGWQLSIPSITRKTDKGLPVYDDHEPTDVFIFAGAEDLVPDDRFPVQPRDGFTVRTYRPRVEGGFARIEWWLDFDDPAKNYWRVISRENITHVLGLTPTARIADPVDPTRIFQWLLQASFDDKGNALVLAYRPEDLVGVKTALLSEQHRLDGTSGIAGAHIETIVYGNQKPLLTSLGAGYFDSINSLIASANDFKSNWLFRAFFDYAARDNSDLTLDNKTWPARDDPFSSHRAGFDIRTYRLCKRILFESNISIEVEGLETGYLGITHGLFFNYESASGKQFAKLAAIQQIHFRRTGASYVNAEWPPLEFDYSIANAMQYNTVPHVDAPGLPEGIDGSRYEWVDLDGEGISGVLSRREGAWWYAPNRWSTNTLTPATPPNVPATGGVFKTQQPLRLQPNATAAQLVDLEGDGALDAVEYIDKTARFYSRTDDKRWTPPRPMRRGPAWNVNDPNVRFIDLDADGKADLLVTEHDCVLWQESQGNDGFGEIHRLAKMLDEKHGPRCVFSEVEQTIFLADMSGDGLTDIVRIRNGDVCYWPNLGYGRFGARVRMDDAPFFAPPNVYDPKRLRLLDADGSGTTDIVYLGGSGTKFWANHSGNAWAAPKTIDLPIAHQFATVSSVDFYGRGTGCLVWSSSATGDIGAHFGVVDLTGGVKPHLIIGIRNNLGAETKLRYASSTQFYLKDLAEGKAWITKLPFPVHVVETVEIYDVISRNRFISRYAYHHGFFDGIEREFRGFGMIEQWDTEQIGTVSKEVADSDNWDASSYVPPAHRKTWFHHGAWRQDATLVAAFKAEYWKGDKVKLDGKSEGIDLEDTIIPDGLTVEEEREACRALRGRMLRQEVFSDDGTSKAANPYEVAEQNFTIQVLQPRGPLRHAVFFVSPRETVHGHYERIGSVDGSLPADPRVTHEMVLKVDEFGNVQQSLSIGYSRRTPIPLMDGQEDRQLTSDERKFQTRTLLTFTQSAFTKAVLTADGWRTPLPSRVRTFEATLAKWSSTLWISYADALKAFADWETGSVGSDRPTLRIIEHVRTLYRKDDLTKLLPDGDLESMAHPGETLKLAITPDHLKLYEARATADDITALLRNSAAGYQEPEGDGHFWISSGRTFFSPDATGEPAGATLELSFARQHFFLPHQFRDPFGNATHIAYDKPILRLIEITDPVGNFTHAVCDYRVLQPKLITDANGNHTAAAFDIRGMVAGTAILGRNQPIGDFGDSIAEITPFLVPLDFLATSSLLADLKNQTKLVSKFLWGLFTPSEHSELISSATTEDRRKEVLAVALNRIIGGDSIYDKQRFQGIALGDETKWLISTKPEGSALQRLNRLLLQDAYPGKFQSLLLDFKPDLSQAEIDAFFSNPIDVAPLLLGNATSRIVYDVLSYHRARRAYEADHTKPDPSLLPVFATTLTRDYHVNDLPSGEQLKHHIPCKFSYSDGFGREIQQKVRTASEVKYTIPVPDTPARWLGSGWTIFNNKGKPVRQYEPFFTGSHKYEFSRIEGVSAILFYDPMDRVVATLRPDHSWEKVVFDPWRHTNWDANDTTAKVDDIGNLILDGNGKPIPALPEDDLDVGDFFRRLATTDWPILPSGSLTWHRLRTAPLATMTAEFNTAIAGFSLEDQKALSLKWNIAGRGNSWRWAAGTGQEALAAEKTAAHAGTPTDTHFDSLGREFLVVTHNKYTDQRSNAAKEEFAHTRTDFDIEGNRVAVTDALLRPVMQWDYDLLGHPLLERSMDAGRRWMLPDAAAQPYRRWDERGHAFEHDYDALRRPLKNWVTKPVSTADPDPQRLCYERFTYGEHPQAPADANLRSRLWIHRDTAGRVDLVRYDAKGNLLESSRRLCTDYKTTPDWNLPDAIESERFTTETAFDAQNRPILMVAPDKINKREASHIRPGYNLAGQISDIRAELAGSPSLMGTARREPYFLIRAIDYNARGQRSIIQYGNNNFIGSDPGIGLRTTLEYDPQTFRLQQLTTVNKDSYKSNGISKDNYQELYYAYDPVGNITAIHDAAQQTFYFKNQVVSPDASYTYDALYRLINATGREHRGQNLPANAWDSHRSGTTDTSSCSFTAFNVPHANDSQAMRNYTQKYVYDLVGNFEAMLHRANGGDWTRNYNYGTKANNRLVSTTIGGGTESYGYDLHGSMISMPHLPVMETDFRDQLSLTQRQIISCAPDRPSSSGQRTFYVYDAKGERVRKVTENNGLRATERIYLGSTEVFREYNTSNTSNAVKFERWSLHISDGQRRFALVETLTKGSDGTQDQVIRCQLPNHLGSACLEVEFTKDDPRIISYEEYHPYGTTAFQATRGTKFAPKRYRFTGKERDEESGLNYHSARYLATWLGRWVSPDPISIAGGINLYGYTNANPTSRKDSKGLRAEKTDDEPTARPQPATGGQLSGPAAISVIDSTQRFGYMKEAKSASSTALDKIRALSSPEEAYKIAEGVSDFRTELREATQGTLSPSARELSQGIDKKLKFSEIADKYLNKLPGIEGEAPQVARGSLEHSERIATAAGMTNRAVKNVALGGKILGYAGLAVGTFFSIREIVKAPPGKKEEVATREVASAISTGIGSSIGASILVGSAVAAGVVGLAPLIALGLLGGYVGAKLIGAPLNELLMNKPQSPYSPQIL